MADAYGKLTGRPGVCIVTRGPGGLERFDRDSYGLSGFHPGRLVDRPGGAVDVRARGVPGDRLPPNVRADVEMGGADRRSGTHPGNGQPRVPYRGLEPARAGGAGAARRRPDRAHRGRGWPTLSRGPAPSRRRADGRASRNAGKVPTALGHDRRRRLVGGGVRRPRRLRRSERSSGHGHVPPPGPSRQPPPLPMSAISTSAPIPP